MPHTGALLTLAWVLWTQALTVTCADVSLGTRCPSWHIRPEGPPLATETFPTEEACKAGRSQRAKASKDTFTMPPDIREFTRHTFWCLPEGVQPNEK